MPRCSPSASAAGRRSSPGCDRDGLWEFVGLVGMRHDAVGKRGLDRRRRERGAGNCRRALCGIGADVALRGLSRRQLRSRDHRGQRVEDVVLCLFGDFGRQRAGLGGAHVIAQRRHFRPGAGLPRNRVRAARARLLAAAAVKPRKSRRFMVSRLWCRNSMKRIAPGMMGCPVAAAQGEARSARNAATFSVIASAAKQSRVFPRKQSGLLRRKGSSQ